MTEPSSAAAPKFHGHPVAHTVGGFLASRAFSADALQMFRAKSILLITWAGRDLWDSIAMVLEESPWQRPSSCM